MCVRSHKSLNAAIEWAEHNVENYEELILPRRLRDMAFNQHIENKNKTKINEYFIFYDYF